MGDKMKSIKEIFEELLMETELFEMAYERKLKNY